MIGCIVAGRLTNLRQVDATKYVFGLTDPASINHLVVFLTGDTPFPPGYAATVHFLWPSLVNPVWTLLGMLSNEKPSAIFKLGGKKTVSKSMDALMDDTSEPSFAAPFAAQASASAQLGISIEPIETVMAQISTLPAGAHALTAAGGVAGASITDLVPVQQGQGPSLDPISIATKLLENLYNHCASYAGSLPMGGNALFGLNWDTTFIPLKALQDWFTATQRRIKADPGFLK
ncbi:hypothetical protein BC831DRAFT_38367 [Entophlyctis helioformis]|nr:hypothetical protein BC831DRAFT_38367 [Entophlyctis helioformis]